MPARSNLREKMFIVADDFRGFSPLALGQIHLGRRTWQQGTAKGSCSFCSQPGSKENRKWPVMIYSQATLTVQLLPLGPHLLRPVEPS